ncbi:hypothetical protein A9Q87_11685 [Flavobacteriales bacterium 34_180_T64]|nr:hypothetical protein A9Q87_11685 [Flavobacteriales bacterium 34_180_T64]
MPIKSYLAHPQEDKKQALFEALSKIEQCEVIPAKNEDLLIVVTDTNSQEEEDKLKKLMENIDSLKLLSMVSGFNTPKND